MKAKIDSIILQNRAISNIYKTNIPSVVELKTFTIKKVENGFGKSGN